MGNSILGILVVGFILLITRGQASGDSGPAVLLGIIGGGLLWALAKPIASVVTSGLDE